MRTRTVAGALASLALTGCTLERAAMPPLAGPSESALSLTMTATPDVILQDGIGSSVVGIVARDASGQPASGVALEAEIFVNDVRVDFGSLSSRRISTNKDGRAAITYYAPAAPPPTAADDVTVTVVVTTIGGNFANAIRRAVLIRLLRPGIILPPNRPPSPELFFSPTSPREGDAVLFDGSKSMDDGQIVAYAWNFGDGGTGTGVRATHRYQLAGTYKVVLTVTDDRGARASTAPVEVVVTPAADPVASFTLSPADPVVGQVVTANGSASKAAPGRTITSWVWDFGDGSAPRTGTTTSHAYATAGSFVVVLTVTDSTGRRGSSSQSLTVKPLPR